VLPDVGDVPVDVLSPRLDQDELRGIASALGYLRGLTGAPETFAGQRVANLLTGVHAELGRAKADPATLLIQTLVASVPPGPRRLEIPGHDGSIYLRRYVLGEAEDGSHIYLHQILRRDLDPELHDHPWPFASLVLLGGYVEERWDPEAFKVTRVMRAPGDAYTMDTTRFHRIAEVPAGEAWSLVFTGPKAKSWGFWHPKTGDYTPWREKVGSRAGMSETHPGRG
jgi:hypothetical protein